MSADRRGGPFGQMEGDPLSFLLYRVFGKMEELARVWSHIYGNAISTCVVAIFRKSERILEEESDEDVATFRWWSLVIYSRPWKAQELLTRGISRGIVHNKERDKSLALEFFSTHRKGLDPWTLWRAPSTRKIPRKNLVLGEILEASLTLLFTVAACQVGEWGPSDRGHEGYNIELQASFLGHPEKPSHSRCPYLYPCSPLSLMDQLNNFTDEKKMMNRSNDLIANYSLCLFDWLTRIDWASFRGVFSHKPFS